MSQTRLGQYASFQASGSIGAYRLVGPATVTTANLVSQWATASSQIIGLSLDDYSSSQAAAVVIGGTGKGQCGASVTCWKAVTGQTDTGLIIDSTDLAATITTLVIPFLAGIALANGSTNSVIEILVRPTNFRFDF